MKLHEKIFYCRKKAGLSQEALAEIAGVSRQAVSKWESGDSVPEISKLPLLAENFDVTVDWLLSEEEPSEIRVYEERAGSVQSKLENFADNLIDSAVNFFKRYGWILGIAVIIYGVFRTFSAIMPLFSLNGYMPAGFAPMIIYSAATCVAFVAAGIAITVILKRKCNRNDK